MQFVTMQQELSDRLGAYDNAVASDLVKIKRWLNMGQQYICGKQNWPFMVAYEQVQTVLDITTGTVDVAGSGTTVTFSSAPAVSVTGRYIKFSTTDDWYEITAHTAAASTATINPAYVDTSSLTAGTYTLRKLLYTTTTPFDSYLDIKKTVNPGRLESLNQREGDFYLPLRYDTGDCWNYIMGPVDSSGNLRFSLLSTPDTVLNLNVRGIKKLADMSADADVSIIPGRWHDAIIDVGAHYGFISLDDSRARTELERGELKIQEMARVFNTDLGRHRVMRPVDSRVYVDPAYTLPSNYGPNVP